MTRSERETREAELRAVAQWYQTVRNNLKNDEVFNLAMHRNKRQAAGLLKHNADLLDKAAAKLFKLADQDEQQRKTDKTIRDAKAIQDTEAAPKAKLKVV